MNSFKSNHSTKIFSKLNTLPIKWQVAQATEIFQAKNPAESFDGIFICPKARKRVGILRHAQPASKIDYLTLKEVEKFQNRKRYETLSNSTMKTKPEIINVTSQNRKR